MQMMKKSLCFILTFIMVMALLPLNSYAAEREKEVSVLDNLVTKAVRPNVSEISEPSDNRIDDLDLDSKNVDLSTWISDRVEQSALSKEIVEQDDLPFSDDSATEINGAEHDAELSLSRDKTDLDPVGAIFPDGLNSLPLIGCNVNFSNNTLTVYGNGTITTSYFQSYTNIYHVVINGNVTLGMGAFYDVPNLCTVTYNSSSAIIGEWAFGNNTKLTSVTINSSVSVIGEHAFENCPALSTVNLPNSLTSIEKECFMNDTSLTSLTLGGNHISLGDSCFLNCTSLNTLNILGSIESVGEYAFIRCISLTDIGFPDGLTSVGFAAFGFCTNLRSVAFPDSMKIIPNDAFHACESLTSVTAHSLETIGSFAFQDCSSLKDIDLSHASEIGENAFARCFALTQVELSDNISAISENCFWECSSLESISIPDSVELIGKQSFYLCTSLRRVVFPDKYITVNSNAFYGCSSIETITDTVKLLNVGEEAFYDSNLLSRIEFSPLTTIISHRAFCNNLSLTSIDFNNAVTMIGDYAFYNCDNINTIERDPILTYVGDAAFHSCAAIWEVILDPSCSRIGSGCYYNCSNLTKVNFNNVSIDIETLSFSACVSLRELINAQNITGLGAYAFYGNESLTDVSAFISVGSFGEGAFDNCTNLKRVIVPDSITEIPSFLCFGCSSLETITLPVNIESIGEFAFCSCASLTSVDIPESVSKIGRGVFAGCVRLSSIHVPGSVTVIEDYTFAQCTGLVSVSGLSNVQGVGERAFSFCEKLNSMDFSSNLKTLKDIAFYGCEKLSDTGNISKVSFIGDNAFHGCAKLIELNFTDVEEIGKYAFMECSSLKSITISSVLKKLGDDAFADCVSLQSIDLRVDLDKLGEQAFVGCERLETVSLSGRIEQIGRCAFYSCKKLTAVTLPVNLNKIGEGAFYDCSSLETINIPDQVSELGISCFYGCSGLEEISLPENLEYISDSLLYCCDSLSSVTVPKYVKRIGVAAFYGCSDMISVSFEGEVQSIGEYAFTCCEKLTSVTLPNSIAAIGDCAFAQCSSLSQITLPNRLTSIGNYLLFQCSRLNTLRINGNVSVIGTSALYDCNKLSDIFFYGDAPMIIADMAMKNTPSNLIIHYNAYTDGWTSPLWTAPDGNSYHTEEIEASEGNSFGRDLMWKYYFETGCLTISGTGDMPDYTSGFDVPWAQYINQISIVHIENGVTSIGDRSFANCNMLQSIYMGNTVTSCGEYAFSDCENLSNVHFSENLRIIEDYSFYNCKSMSAELPDTLRKIGRYAFFACSGLRRIDIPDTVEEIGEGVFYRCTGLEKVALPASITAVPDYAFRGCGALNQIVLSDSIDTIGKYSFGDCEILKSVFILGNSVYISNYAFSGCNNLTDVIFDAGSPSNIGHHAFRGCEEIKAHFTSNSQDAPDSFETDDGSVIACERLTATDFGTCGVNCDWYYYDDFGLLIISGEGSTDNYNSDSQPWESYKDNILYIVVKSGITVLGDYIFCGCQKLNKVILPTSLKCVGKGAFSDCVDLMSIQLPSGITELQSSAFYHCNSLSYISIPEKVTSISDYAFALCSDLKHIDFGTKLNSIGYSSFYACEELSGITFHSNGISINSWAFARCGNLEHITGSEKAVSIGEYAFYGCESLKDYTFSKDINAISDYAFAGTELSVVALPDSVTSIGTRAFWGSNINRISFSNVKTISDFAFFESGLTSIIIPSVTESIGELAFGKCDSLLDITVDEENRFFTADDGVLYDKEMKTLIQYPNGKTGSSLRIKEGVQLTATGAFYGSDLSEISLPESLQELGNASFAENERLKSVELPSRLAALPVGVFSKCSQLEEITLHGDITDIGVDAFYGCDSLQSAVFEGDAPTVIGSDAFDNVGENFTILYAADAEGWTDGTWNGPDGNSYQTSCIGMTGKKYFFSLETNGGNINDYYIGEYVSGTEKELPKNVVKEGFVFAGWYDNEELSGEAFTAIPATASANLKFFAKWDKDGRESEVELISQIFDSESRTISVNVKIINRSSRSENAVVVAAAYSSNNSLLAMDSTKIELTGLSDYPLSFKLFGGRLEKDAQIKFFVLSTGRYESLYEPLMKNLCFNCDYAISGQDSCILSIDAKKAPKSDIETTGTSDGSTFDLIYTMGRGDFNKVLFDLDKGRVCGFDAGLSVAYGENTTNIAYTTDISLVDFDHEKGYILPPISVESGKTDKMTANVRSWMPEKYNNFRVASKCRILADTQACTLSDYSVSISRDIRNIISFNLLDQSLLTLRSSGYCSLAADAIAQKLPNHHFAMVVPYNGRNVCFELDAQQVLNAALQNAVPKHSADGVRNINISFVLKNENGSESTFFKAKVTQGSVPGEIEDIELVDYEVFSTNQNDLTYKPLFADESAVPEESMSLSLNEISPSKGSNGSVTLKLSGSMMKMNDEIVLTDGVQELKPIHTYFYAHDKVYATFDLSGASDSLFSVRVRQGDNSVSLDNCFTLDSNLPKGSLRTSVNVNKTAPINKECGGSVTFTNPGYTDAYAPVIYIDTANMRFKDENGSDFATTKTLFVPNSSSLPGIISGGETAAYNFTYVLTSKKGFTMSVYNYTDIHDKVLDEVKLTESSGPYDYLNYNINSMMGINGDQFNESIALMANTLGALGDDNFNVSYLHNSYTASAQGALVGSTLGASNDISSRELSLSRYFYNNIDARMDKGLFGQGWYSDYDIKAEHIVKDGKDYIQLNSPTGLSVYNLNEGVYTESIYGQSTASIADGAITVADKSGNKTEFDTNGRLAKCVDTYGNYMQLHYTDSKLTKITSSNGDELDFVYDGNDLLSVTSPVTGSMVQYEHAEEYLISVSGMYGSQSYEYNLTDLNGRKNTLSKITSDSFPTETIEYDDFGRIISISTAEATIRYDYPDVNKVVVTDAMGDTSTLYFNGAGQLTRQAYSDGTMIESDYSPYLLANGICMNFFNTVRNERDDNHNVTKAVDNSGLSVEYSYNAKNQMTSVTDQGGLTTLYHRNDKGSVNRLVYSDGLAESYEYDAKGNVTASVHRDGTRTEYDYDEYSQLEKVRYEDGKTISYKYDDAGNIVDVIDNGAHTSMKYNKRNDLIEVVNPDNSIVSYGYGANGQVVSVTVNDGVHIANYSYTYDEMGRIADVFFQNMLIASYEYNIDGTLKKQTNNNGTSTEYTYERGTLKSIYNYADDASVMSFFEYTYDDMGNIASQRENAGTWTYGYDSVGQLTRAVSPSGETTLYNYDLSGNRIAVSKNGSVINYNSNELNQYTSYRDAVREYDDNGRLVKQTDSAGTTVYEYDYHDRLVKVVQPDGTVTDYGYDVFGLRNSVSVTKPGAEEADITRYINSPLGEGSAVETLHGNVKDFMIQANGLVGYMDYDFDAGRVRLFTHSYNHLGSTAEVTDNTGALINRYTYDQEGNILTANEEKPTPFKYVGKYGIATDENGLYYARARYIDSGTMSFITRDPSGQSGDLNLYRYACNNPVLYADINGRYAMALFNPCTAALVSNPVGLVVVGAIVVGGGVYWCCTHKKEVSSAMNRAGKFIGGTVKNVKAVMDITNPVAIPLKLAFDSVDGVGGNSLGGSSNGNKNKGGPPLGPVDVVKLLAAEQLFEYGKDSVPTCWYYGRVLIEELGKHLNILGNGLMQPVYAEEIKLEDSNGTILKTGGSLLDSINSYIYLNYLDMDRAGQLSTLSSRDIGSNPTDGFKQQYQKKYGKPYNAAQTIPPSLVPLIDRNPNLWDKLVGAIKGAINTIVRVFMSLIGR